MGMTGKSGGILLYPGNTSPGSLCILQTNHTELMRPEGILKAARSVVVDGKRLRLEKCVFYPGSYARRLK